MKLLKDEGIVIRKYDYGESDRVVVLFTKKYGKISGIVKGIRKSKKRETASTDILSISDFMFCEKDDRIYISSSELKKSLIRVSDNSFKISIMFYLMKVIDVFVQEKNKNERVYEISIKLLEYIEREREREKILVAMSYYLLKILKIEGVISEISGEGLYLNLNELCFIEKKDENTVKLEEREKKFLICLNKVDIESINRLKFKENEILDIIEIFEKFILLNIDEKINLKYFLREDL